MKYDINSLIEIFKRHSLKFEKDQKELKKKYPEREKFEDEDFSITYALLSICIEIKKLKESSWHAKSQ